MDAILEIEAGLEFQRGKELGKRTETLNEAIEVLGELYEKIVSTEGDLAVKVAPIASLYGDTYLRLAIESNNELVNAELKKRADEQSKLHAGESGGGHEEKEEAKEEEEEEAEEPAAPMSKDDITELFEIAWECLDTSRVIYEKLLNESNLDGDSKKVVMGRVAHVLLRLGDLKLEQGQFEESIPDFESCLAYRHQVDQPSSRDLASAYHSLAMAFEFAATERPNVEHRIKATENFAKAQVALRLQRAKLLGVRGSQEGIDVGGSKKKLMRSARFVSTLAPEHLQVLDDAVASAYAPLDPAASPTEAPEVKELTELIEALTGKVDDVSWHFTEEAQKAEEELAKERAVNQQPVEEEGFGTSSSSLVASTVLLQPHAETTNETKPPPTPVQMNVLQPRKREKPVAQ